MTIMVVVAIVLLILHWRGPNAVWGGATLGAIVGLIIAIINGDWSLLAISFAVGTFAGTFFEWIGRLAVVALKEDRAPSLPSRETPLELDFLQVEEKDTTYDNLEYDYSFSYPSSWSSVGLIPEIPNVAVVGSPLGLAAYYVFVSDHCESPEDRINNQMKDIKQGKKRSTKFTILSKPKSFNFHGYPACTVQYNFSKTTSEGKAIKRTDICICVTRKGYDYTILLGVEQGGDQDKEEMDAIHRSFKFTK